MYDLLIKGGTLIDGSGSAAVLADIGIIGDKIIEIGLIKATHSSRTIDATGRYVCPGFIDIHTHSDLTLALDGRAFSSLSQGITTQIMGNCGVSAAPTREYELYHGPLDPTMTRELTCDWLNFEDYFKRLNDQGMGTNVATLVGHGNIRVAAMGYDDRVPTKREINKMIDLTEIAMEDGCFGLSSGLAYAPGPFADSEELIELGRIVSKYNGIYTSHIRNQTEGIEDAVQEVFTVGEKANLPAHVSHMQPGAPMIGSTKTLLANMSKLRSNGIDVSCDAIPYTIGSTTLKSLLPPWALDGGDQRLLERLRDPEMRECIKADTMKYGAESGGSRKRNLVKKEKWSSIWLSSAIINAQLTGKNFVEIGQIRNQSPHDAVIDIIIEDEAQPWMLAEDVSEQDFLNIALDPAGGIISDGFSLVPEGILAEGKHHPRSYGAFPYFLRRFVREKKALSWEYAIHKLSSHAAKRFGLLNRGLISEGFQADILVFNPNTISEKANFENPYIYAKGIDHVLVNGKNAIEDGELIDARAGQILQKKTQEQLL
jgi:N-acyl-D-amino-acid deacylase